MAEVKISVLLDGNLIQADGLSRFTFIPSGRHYIIYTLNEKTIQDGNSLNKVYVSEEGDVNAQFQPISQDEWVNLKSIMGQLSETNVTIPNNIQLAQLNEMQYTVGPYKKIAINDNVMQNILSNQLTNQPTEEKIEQPKATGQFFDPSVNESAMEEENATTSTEVPNAFTMSAPVPEETAPVSLVQETAPAPVEAPPVSVPEPTMLEQPTVPAQTELVSATLVEPPQEVVQSQTVELVQPVEPVVPVVEQPVVAEVTTPVVQPAPIVPAAPVQSVDETTEVKESLQKVIDYCKGDMNKFNQLLSEHGLSISVQNGTNVATPNVTTENTVSTPSVTTVVQPVAEEVKEEIPEPVTSIMDINNLPVVEQEAPAEENVLQEESFEPTAPTLPIDNMDAPAVIDSMPDGVMPSEIPTSEQVVTQVSTPAPTEVVQTIVQPPVEPIQTTKIVPPVATTELVQPVESIVPTVSTENIAPVVPTESVASVEATPTPIVQPVVETPVSPIATPLIEPAPETNTLVEPTPMVQPVVENTIEPVDDITQTTIVESTQPVENKPSVVETISNSEVNIALPTDIAVPGSAPTQNNIPQAGPPIIPVTPMDVAPAPKKTDEIDPATFLDAGNVVIPDGQSGTNAQGLPGDSAAV